MIISFAGRTYDMRTKAITVEQLKRNDILLIEEKLYRASKIEQRQGGYYKVTTKNTYGSMQVRVWKADKSLRVYRRNW